MVNLHEHEFKKTNTKIGIAYIEDLKPFADIDYNNLEVFEDDGAKYHLQRLMITSRFIKSLY